MADVAAAAHRDVKFAEAPALFFKNYVKFEGRSSRGAYWWFFLANVIVSFVLGFIDGTLGLYAGGVGTLGGLWTLAILIPSIAIGMRRLHDIDKSGWWLLIAFIPLVGVIWLIVLFCQPGKRADTQFGGPDVGAGR